MLTWTRLGFLGFMIPFAFWGIAAVGWGVQTTRPFRIATVLAAVVVWFVGTKLNSEAQDQGEYPHKAFGFPMQWSGLALSAFGFMLSLS